MILKAKNFLQHENNQIKKNYLLIYQILPSCGYLAEKLEKEFCFVIFKLQLQVIFLNTYNFINHNKVKLANTFECKRDIIARITLTIVCYSKNKSEKLHTLLFI